jgi:hypothetical protein
MLYPLVRAGRIASACALFPGHELTAIAGSEIASVVLPLINPKTITRIVGTVMAMSYAPRYTSFFIKNYQKQDLVYMQAEVCFMLLFILNAIINKI